MKALGFLLCLGLLLACGCRTKGPRFDPRQALPAATGSTVDLAFEPLDTTNRIDPEWLRPPTEPVKLGPGDTIEIETLGEGASRTEVLVGPDGKIYYSLLPGLSVWGMTLSESKGLLEQEISKYTRIKPEMVVNLRTVGSQRVWVLGAVTTPGVYTLATPATLLEALTSVGGIPARGVAQDPIADLANSFVLRDGRLLPVDFERLLYRGDLSQNIYLQPDDFIYVRSASNPSVYVLGAVRGASILPADSETTLARSIISVGGTMPYANVRKVVIVRGGLTQPKVAEVDYQDIIKGKAPDVRLVPGDIVYVPFVPYRKLAQFAEQVIRQFVYTIAVNEGSNLVRDTDLNVSVPVGIDVNPPLVQPSVPLR